MADGSTATVDGTRGEGASAPPSEQAPGVTDDGRTEDAPAAEQQPGDGTDAADRAGEPNRAPGGIPCPELHSGDKLAARYRLEECLTRLDGFSSWRAVDEKLRRAVGVHLLPADHPRARNVLSAARSAALLGDPRFVQVLDAVEENELVHVVHEWVPDGITLADLLETGPLAAHEAYQLVVQLSQALSAAHREGLAHLQLSPTSVLRTASGQYRIRGLAVGAALRGVTSDHPQRDDTEAIGALLYAALTQRWPYQEDAFGLPGIGALSGGSPIAPDQVRAGVHRGLSDLAMRALVNHGATASREEQPCANVEDLAKAVAALPRIRPPEQAYTAPPAYPGSSAGRPASGAPGGAGGPVTAVGTPPALPGRTGRMLKWGVSALLIAALGLGSWQVSESLLRNDDSTDNTPVQQAEAPQNGQGGEPLSIVDAVAIDPEGNGSENPETVPRAFDDDPDSFWYTQNYYGDPRFGRLKPGVGLVLDLGKEQSVGGVTVSFEGRTSAELLAAPASTSTMPTSYDSFRKTAEATGSELDFAAGEKPLTTRYLLVWLTELPQATDGNYRGRITEIQVSS
ncbi:protein kinase family protein [Streptomyces sp. TR06-5]|uniref:protein kinase family protein n=1 Tax=Streptomyces sp. TR06-5 TaxID=3385976 RepID=UPI0039A2BF4F